MAGWDTKRYFLLLSWFYQVFCHSYGTLAYQIACNKSVGQKQILFQQIIRNHNMPDEVQWDGNLEFRLAELPLQSQLPPACGQTSYLGTLSRDQPVIKQRGGKHNKILQVQNCLPNSAETSYCDGIASRWDCWGHETTVLYLPIWPRVALCLIGKEPCFGVSPPFARR